MDEQTNLQRGRESSSAFEMPDPVDVGELLIELPGLLWDGLRGLLEFVIGGLLESLGALF